MLRLYLRKLTGFSYAGAIEEIIALAGSAMDQHSFGSIFVKKNQLDI
jgi:hypothetical protein